MMVKKRIVVTIEARMTSSRLPGKVLLKSCGKPLLQHMIERLRRSKSIDDIIVATTTNDTDNTIVELCEKINCHYYRGSEENVLQRVLQAAQYYHADVIVETTGDCPCIDWRHIDRLVNFYNNNEYDFVSNCTEPSYPDGFNIRIFSTQALERVNRLTDDPKDREHVSIFFPNHPEIFKSYNDKAQGIEYRPELEITLDEIGDYKLIDAIFEGLYPGNNDFSYLDILSFIDLNPQFLKYVEGIVRKTI